MASRIQSVIFLILLGCNAAVGQRGYIASDTSYSQVVLLNRSVFNNNRSIRFQHFTEEPFQILYPKDLKEFGFDDGDVYVKKAIQDPDSIKEYFLLRLIDGKRKLYELKTKHGPRLFGENKNTWIEIKRDTSLQRVLSRLLDSCDNFTKNIPLVRPNQRSLKRAFKMYNGCWNGSFPTFRKGILSGFSITTLAIIDPTSHRTIRLTNTPSLFAGGFIELPLGQTPRLFLNLQVYYQQNSYHTYQQESNQNLDFLIHTSAISVPLLFKYRSSGARLRQFITIGPTLTQYLKKDDRLVQATTSGSEIDISIISLNTISDTQISARFGLGLEYSITAKKSLSVEMHYEKGIGIGNFNNQSVSAIQTTAYFFF